MGPPLLRNLCLILVSGLTSSVVLAQDDPPPVPQHAASMSRDPQAPTSGTTVSDDKFTGSLSLRVPIDVPGGTNHLEPHIALVYRSSAPSTWLGVGWDLNLGAIERSTKGGDYNSDSFLLKLSDSSSEIVKTPRGRFATRIRLQAWSRDGGR